MKKFVRLKRSIIDEKPGEFPVATVNLSEIAHVVFNGRYTDEENGWVKFACVTMKDSNIEFTASNVDELARALGMKKAPSWKELKTAKGLDPEP